MGVQAVDMTGSEHSEGQPAGDGVESIWDNKTMSRIIEFADDVAKAKDERAAITARVAAKKTALIDMGFNKDAVEAAVKYARLEEDKRENFDLSYIFCRKALGTPIQDDLFAAAVQQQVTVTTRRKAEAE